MKVQVRRGVFESNSSSSHSISLVGGKGKRFTLKDIPVTEDNRIKIELGEFGWGLESYTDIPTKLSYLATQVYCYSDITREDLDRLSAEEIGDNQCFYELQGWAQENGFAGLSITRGDDVYSIPYVDHQSLCGNISSLLKDSNIESITEFLLNSNVELEIDNDNH